jgi:hypothetical protein
MDNVKCEIAKHPSDDTKNWIHYPVHVLPPVHLAISEESLIEIATRSSAKIVFNQKPLPDFWIGLRSEYPALTNHAVKTLMPFATTDLCESGFSALISMKTKYSHRLCVKNDLRLRLSPIQPNLPEFCASFQAHPSH